MEARISQPCAWASFAALKPQAGLACAFLKTVRALAKLFVRSQLTRGMVRPHGQRRKRQAKSAEPKAWSEHFGKQTLERFEQAVALAHVHRQDVGFRLEQRGHPRYFAQKKKIESESSYKSSSSCLSLKKRAIKWFRGEWAQVDCCDVFAPLAMGVVARPNPHHSPKAKIPRP